MFKNTFHITNNSLIELNENDNFGVLFEFDELTEIEWVKMIESFRMEKITFQFSILFPLRFKVNQLGCD
jgi:hypothetical protein